MLSIPREHQYPFNFTCLKANPDNKWSVKLLLNLTIYAICSIGNQHFDLDLYGQGQIITVAGQPYLEQNQRKHTVYA
jgi:hypothetical protein